MVNALSRIRRAFHDATPSERLEFVRQFDTDLDRSAESSFSRPRAVAAVLLASALGLYLELVMVRWHASCMHTFGVFKNVSMLSCFLGLGIGYATASRKQVARVGIVLPLLAVQCLTFAIISRTRLGRLSLNPVAEHYIMWQSDWRWWVEGIGGNLFLAATFALNACMFIPIGQVTGRLMARLPTLHAYSLNLAGSLAGVGLVVLLSALWSPPILWMALAVLGWVPFVVSPPEMQSQLKPTRSVAIVAVSLAVMLLAFGLIDRAGIQHYYSPYQAITCQLGADSKYPCVARILVNNASFQRVLDLSREAQAKNAALRRIAQYYDLPHQFKADARRVLVVGAGTGNDVAAALRSNAERITAVEIDPTILFLGKRLHPERPYDDPRVEIVNDDARTFLRRTSDQFDTIVYGLLDSHTTLGSMTNVRLDSFVYTVEAFREAAARLSDDGLLAVTFAVMTPQQGKKLYLMLEEAFQGLKPRCFEVGYDAGVMMVTGPGIHRLPATPARLKEVTARFADARLVAEVSSDDWPFFYMPRRTYPITYAVMITLLLGISAVMIRGRLGRTGASGGLFGTFFFLGAGFMLIETKAITQLGLVLGNTWHVLAAVITSIVVLAFLANLWILWHGPVGRRTAFACLVASLLVGAAVSWLDSAGWQVPMPKLTMTIALTLPLFFSGLVFSSELARRSELPTVMASNLLGAMLGGFLEYNSMYWGYSSLTWLGLLIYALAYVCPGRPFETIGRFLAQTPAAAT